MSQYLEFAEIVDTGKTKIFAVLSKSSGDRLATISWHGPWRQYTFKPEPKTIWNTGCLVDVNAFIDARMAERRQR